MNMNPRDAVLRYQFGERAKSELIIVSQLLMTLPDYKNDRKTGAKRMLISLMEAVRSELNISFNATKERDFQRAIDRLNEAISQTESDQYGSAGVMIGEAVSAVTTVAQYGWQVLNEHGYL